MYQQATTSKVLDRLVLHRALQEHSDGIRGYAGERDGGVDRLVLHWRGGVLVGGSGCAAGELCACMGGGV